MENTTIKIKCWELKNGKEIPLLPTSTLDGFEWNAKYRLTVSDDDGSLGLPFLFAADDAAILTVTRTEQEGKKVSNKTIEQVISCVPRSLGNEITCSRIRSYNGKEHVWSAWETISSASGTKVTWDASSCVDTFIAAGIYNIRGERLNVNDALPIANSNPGHTISARLVVLDSSISGTGDTDDKCITQILTLSNRTGGDGDVYIRTGRARSTNMLAGGSGWEPWGKLQQNIEVGQVRSLDTFTGNGIYSGVYTNGSSFFETFVMVVINNYVVAGATGQVRSISQFKYALNVDGTFSYKTRTGRGNTGISWGEWVDLGAATTTDIQDNSITAQKLSSDVAANIAKSANGFYWTSGPNAVTLNINKNDGTVGGQTLPAATTEKAGVMSADILNAITVSAELLENKVILAAGNANTNANYDASDYIAIPNSVIDLSASGWLAGGALLVAFYDSQKAFISGYGNFGDATSKFYSIVHFAIPENARYVRYSSNRVKDKTILVWGNREYNENIDALLPISIEWIDGEFVNRGGVTAVNSTWCRSDYVEVSEFSGITIKAYCRGTVLSCAFYDANYKYLSGIGDYGYTVMTAIHINAVVPADAKYMRVSTAVARKDDTVFLVNGMRIANNENTIAFDTLATQIIPAQFYRKQSGDSLRVLCFGSSWLTNTWWYLNKLTQAVGINATIKCYFSSACPFSKWVDRYEGKEETGTSTDFRRFDSVNGSDWSVEYVTDTTEFKHSLEEDWDVIVFQQGSSDSTNWNSDNGYANHYQKLMSYIKRSAKPWTVICYNNTWTPKLGAGSTQTKEAQQKWQELNNENCIKFTNAVGLSNFVIPCGAAVWALRNDSVITDADDFMKDDLHIKNGLPIYLTGLTLFRAVVTPFYGVDIDDIAWLPDESTQKNPSSESSWMSIDSEQAARVKQMVKLAFSNRYGFYTL